MAVLTRQPVPYQGSKRLLASTILSFAPSGTVTLFEPFAGSAAVTQAAALLRSARRFVINDSLQPLADIWRMILEEPEALAANYRVLWEAQLGDEESHYYLVREAFNRDQDPVKLLYLLARCVKNAVRFNRVGEFNQSPDKRRKGVRPATLRRNVFEAHRLLAGKTSVSARDYAAVLDDATARDLVYMDPPYQGTSQGRDRRYHESLDLGRFFDSLDRLNVRGVPFLLSFDGRCGTRHYGRSLPTDLRLTRIEIEVGRSSQATLNGRNEVTVESLYVSPALGRQNHGKSYVRLRPQLALEIPANQ